MISASWLAKRMAARRTLELIAAIVIVIVGLLILAGAF
jgi:hypothetical protein